MISLDKKRGVFLRIEALGFGSLILLSWLDEALHLPRLLFGGQHSWDWPECVVETALVLLVWFAMRWSTRRARARLFYLEGFLRLCAWCRRVDYDGQWMSVETFFNKGLDTSTTHGICPDCKARVFAGLPAPMVNQEQKERG